MPPKREKALTVAENMANEKKRSEQLAVNAIRRASFIGSTERMGDQKKEAKVEVKSAKVAVSVVKSSQPKEEVSDLLCEIHVLT